MKKAAVIGVYGIGKDFTTGQAVKCHMVIDWLKDKYGDEEVSVVNTYKWQKHPFRLIRQVIGAMRLSKNIVIMPAQHGIKIFAPLIYYLNGIFHCNIYYIVIGGWLAGMLEANASMKKCIGAYNGVYVETMSMKRNLENIGLNNIYYMPNSRPYRGIIKKEYKKKNFPYRICTYSRVTESKGIEDAVMICKKANELMNGTFFVLDVFGKVAEEYEQKFKKLIRENGDIATYMGCKTADETAKTLGDYYALLFPTYYEGEGFAGTILDAFAVGIPIIANDWKYNSEIITDGVNGFIYPFRDVEEAAKLLLRLYQESDMYEIIQKGCNESAIRYSTDHVMREFADTLQ